MNRKILTLYHGSQVIVKKSKLKYGRTDNDYGQGFYCTAEPDLAKEWACISLDGGYINRYELDMTGLKMLDLSGVEHVPLQWLALLLANRKVRISSPAEKRGQAFLLEHFLPDISGYDVLRGYRADDSYFSFARAFLANTITEEQLAMAMRLGELGEQIVLKSENAFRELSYQSQEPVDGSVYYPLRLQRDRSAREAYHALLEESSISGKYLIDYMREET